MTMGTTLKLLSAGAVKAGVCQVAAAFERASGCTVQVEFATAPTVRARVLGGEDADVIVAPDTVMDELSQHGRIVSVTRGRLGSARMGVFVRQGASLPDISTAAAFRQALLDADTVVYNQASSGIYMAKLLPRLGIADVLKDRIVQPASGAAVMEHVAQAGGRTIGVAQTSEIRVQLSKGLPIIFAGLLPDEIQNVTVYHAAAACGRGDDAAALAHALSNTEAKAVFVATWIE